MSWLSTPWALELKACHLVGRSARPVKRGRGDSSCQAASLGIHCNPQSGENGHSLEDDSKSDSRESASPSDSSADASEDGLGPMPGRTIRCASFPKMPQAGFFLGLAMGWLEQFDSLQPRLQVAESGGQRIA